VDGSSVVSGNVFFIRLCRYLISRGRTRFEPVLQESSSLGYVIPIFELFSRKGVYQFGEYVSFYQSMYEKGYIKVVRFINKIYLCPKCLHSHLLYIESCPRCHNSDIKGESVIHHFRCANISPEHTYNFGGQLRCPKCHQLLRHIGVDHDRPSVVYTCSHCDNMFLQPQMSVVCTACHSTSEVSDLTPHDITAFEFTPSGREAMVSPNIGFTIYTDFFDNYMEYDRFIGRLRLLAELSDVDSNIDTNLSVARVWVLDENETTVQLRGDIISLFCRRFPTHKVSSANNMVYIKGIIDKEDGVGVHDNEDFRTDIEQALWQASTLLFDNERIAYAMSGPVGNSMDEFLAALRFVAPMPDKIYLSSGHIEAKPQPAQEQGNEASSDGDGNAGEEVTENQSETVEAEPLIPVETEMESAEAEESGMKQKLAEMDDEINHPSRRRPLIIALVVILLVALAAVCWFFFPKTLGSAGSKSAIAAVTTTEMQPATVGDSAADKTKGNGSQFNGGVIGDMQPGMYYVITATLTTEEQVLEELENSAEASEGQQLHVYRYGRRFVLSAYSSAKRRDCERYILGQNQRGKYWIATTGDIQQ